MKKFELKESEANLLFQTTLDKLVIKMLADTLDDIPNLTEWGKTRIMNGWVETHIERGLIRKCVFGKDYTLYHQELLKLFNDAYETAVITYHHILRNKAYDRF